MVVGKTDNFVLKCGVCLGTVSQCTCHLPYPGSSPGARLQSLDRAKRRPGAPRLHAEGMVITPDSGAILDEAGGPYALIKDEEETKG